MGQAGTEGVEHALKADPKRHRVEFENSEVRVVRIKYGPKEKVVMHSHPAGVLVFLTDQHVRFNFPDGSSEEIRKKAGETMWMDAVTHQPENLSDHPLEVLYIEAQ